MKYNVIGLMSGTSLDGLDLAFCEFENVNKQWKYYILNAETIPYSSEWRRRLSTLESASAFEFVAADVEYGHLLGKLTIDFIKKFHLHPDFIASHGHTIFHQPEKKITSQIGRGSAIAAETGLPVICDFRSLDVALGGQGAPLVPIGDQLLFGHIEYCLNLGGFANISFQRGDRRIAFDVSPANIVLNYLARIVGYEYDEDGRLASEGKINRQLYDALNSLAFYHTQPPKSLGKEWVVNSVFPLLNDLQIPVNDLLATFCEHIAIQVALAATGSPSDKLMITGGGALNSFLISRIRHYTKPQIIIPDANTINYKEALIFAFLGVLRWRNEDNCLKSVTGAIRDSSGGAVY
ncbi:MAG: anhydro-N-acetylmuramic acid kinase [Bacteroidetes bacterium]|nr:anhydro-N-acetylmuramic acid kinase [Bacteroidota bacterium]